jgi:hypothetical protein
MGSSLCVSLSGKDVHQSSCSHGKRVRKLQLQQGTLEHEMQFLIGNVGDCKKDNV